MDIKRIFALLASTFIMLAACILNGCSKEESDKKESDKKDKRPEYSIKVYRDNKLIFEGDRFVASYGMNFTSLKTFWWEDLIVVKKYPDDPNSTLIEAGKKLDDGTFFYLSIKVAGGMYDGVAEERKLITEKTYPVYQASDDGLLEDFLGIQFLYNGSTDDVKWTHKGGSHTITNKFVATDTIKDDNGNEVKLDSDYINGKFSITYSDKSGEHTMTGEYKNLILYN